MRSLVWWGVLALAAVLCAGMQLDRQARRDGSYAELVPAPFRNFAQVVLANRTLASGTAEEALRETRLLIARSPIPAEHVTLFALAAASSGDAERAERALLTSGGRGWREPLAQLFLADTLLQAGLHGEAAKRLLGLWVLGSRKDTVIDGFEEVLAKPDGRDVVLQWVVDTPRQSTNFAGWAVSELDRELSSRLVAATHNTGAAIDCMGYERFLQRYLRQGAADAAVRAKPPSCGEAGLANARFADRRKGYGAWEAANGAFFVGDEGLHYDNRLPGYRKIAEALVTLSPGSYQVRVEHNSRRADLDAPLRMDLFCIVPGGKVRMAGGVRFDGDEDRLIVPAAACAVQNIKLMAPRGRGRFAEVQFVADATVGR